MSDVTRILSRIESGDPSAAEQLLPLVYDELRKLVVATLAQVREFGVDFRNSGAENGRKSNADGAGSGDKRCSEDLLR